MSLIFRRWVGKLRGNTEIPKPPNQDNPMCNVRLTSSTIHKRGADVSDVPDVCLIRGGPKGVEAEETIDTTPETNVWGGQREGASAGNFSMIDRRCQRK